MNCWICLFLTSAALAQQTHSERDVPATIEGHVLHGVTGESLRKVHVTLELSEEGHDSALVATTDEAGRFRFTDIKAGSYKLTAEKRGFLDGAYDKVKPGDDESILKVSSGDRMYDLSLRLFPGGTISGQVVDADGDSVAGDEVILWTRPRTHGGTRNSHVGQTTTNQAGEYRFDGLSPGTYYVSASAGAWGYAVRQIPVDSSGKVTKVHDLTTFYPAALSLADAQSVSIESGPQQLGLDIRIRRGATLSVKGRIAGTTGLLSKFSLSATIDDGIGWTSETGEILANGDFVFKELPPGKHRLTLLDHGTNGFQTIGITKVDVIDQDLTGVVITPFKPAQVRVRVVLEGEEDKPLTTGSVFLYPAVEGIGNGMSSLLQYQPRNGTYVIDDVPPEKYRVWFNNASDSYLKLVQSGERKVDPESIDVGEGAVLDLLMTFSRNVASVSGDVEVPQDRSGHSVHVLLVSEEAAGPSESKYYSPALDQSLHFSSAQMRPGKYLAFAAQEDDSDLWYNADFLKLLQPEGKEIELHEKEQSSIHLKLITKAETDRIRKQIGI